CARSSGSFETKNGVEALLVLKNLGDPLLGDLGITPVVVDLVEGHIRIFLQLLLDAAKALVQVVLVVNCQQDHAPVLVQHVRDEPPALQPGAKIVGGDKDVAFVFLVKRLFAGSEENDRKQSRKAGYFQTAGHRGPPFVAATRKG